MRHHRATGLTMAGPALSHSCGEVRPEPRRHAGTFPLMRECAARPCQTSPSDINEKEA